jgi:hypothetical protein
MKKMVLDGVPRLLLYATKNIRCGEELRYDYGVGDLPWRCQHEVIFTHQNKYFQQVVLKASGAIRFSPILHTNIKDSNKLYTNFYDLVMICRTHVLDGFLKGKGHI